MGVQIGTPWAATIGVAEKYTLRVENQGPANATGVVASLSLAPTPMDFRAIPEGCSRNGQSITCEIAQLPAGSSQEFEVSAAPLGLDRSRTRTRAGAPGYYRPARACRRFARWPAYPDSYWDGEVVSPPCRSTITTALQLVFSRVRIRDARSLPAGKRGAAGPQQEVRYRRLDV